MSITVHISLEIHSFNRISILKIKFQSIHPEMEDLQIPQWSYNLDGFLQKHRSALESRHVSCRLHNWIDLYYGYKYCLFNLFMSNPRYQNLS